MKRIHRVLCLLALMMLASPVVLAAPLGGGSIAPVADTYTDRAENTSSHDAMGLVFSSTDPGPASGVATRIIFLKFDLRPTGSSNVNGSTGSLPPTLGSITQARLNLAFPANCGFNAPNVAISVYPVANANDGWSGSLQWGPSIDSPTHPPRDTTTPVGTSALATLDEGTVGAPGVYYHWSDTNTGSYGLAEWLQAQRTTGDGFATLRLEVTAGNSNFGFEDSEGTAKGFSCTVPSPGGPRLQVADASGPLAVTLRFFRSTGPAVNWPLIAGGAALLALAGGLGVYRWRVSRVRAR